VPPLRVLDVFAGAGGFSEGFRAAGYDIVGAIELDLAATSTLYLNHPETPVAYGEDVRDFSGEDVFRLTDCPIDVVIAGPPCQGFSITGARDPQHESSDLLREAARIIEEVKPTGFLIENVPGLLSFQKGLLLDRFMRRLNGVRVGKHRYSVVLDTLDAVEFGVPQHRKRVFICGLLGEPFTFPAPSSSRVSLLEGIGDLPEWTTDANEIGRMPTPPRLTPYQAARRNGDHALYNHSAKRLRQLRRARLAELNEGDDRRALPEHLQSGGREGKYRRLLGSAPAPTLTAHMAKDTSDFIHPRYDRMLTVREAARLQSFDDSYRFTGYQSQQFTQVGNSVAPLVAEALADALRPAARRAVRRLQVGRGRARPRSERARRVVTA
jgi:DNA (cytosine-5)-methyltransferase 1